MKFKNSCQAGRGVGLKSISKIGSRIDAVVVIARVSADLSLALMSFSRELRPFSRELRPFSRESRPFSRESRPFSREVRSFSREVRSFSREVRPFSRELRSFSREVRSFSRESGLLSRDSKSFSRAFLLLYLCLTLLLRPSGVPLIRDRRNMKEPQQCLLPKVQTSSELVSLRIFW